MSIIFTDENKFRLEYPGVWDTAEAFLVGYGIDSMMYKFQSAECFPYAGKYTLAVVDIDTESLVFEFKMKRRATQLIVENFSMLFDPQED